VSDFRPTMRCIRDDLHVAIPSINKPLDDLDHVLVRKGRAAFVGGHAGERIRSIDDEVVFKVKVARWRGAAWPDRYDNLSPSRVWLIDAGMREEGSQDDFYEVFATSARKQRAAYNAANPRPLPTDTYISAKYLPIRDDFDRLQAEAAVRVSGRIRAEVRAITRASLADGREHSTNIAGASIGIQVRADDGHETYISVRITGSFRPETVSIVLHAVPGCDASWGPESAMPDRPLRANEQVWSNIMDAQEAARFLDEMDDGP